MYWHFKGHQLSLSFGTINFDMFHCTIEIQFEIFTMVLTFAFSDESLPSICSNVNGMKHITLSIILKSKIRWMYINSSLIPNISSQTSLVCFIFNREFQCEIFECLSHNILRIFTQISF